MNHCRKPTGSTETALCGRNRWEGVRVVLGCLLLGAAPLSTLAQDAEPQLPDSPAAELSKEELLNLLETRQAKLDLEHAKSEMGRAQVDYEEIKGLFDERIVAIDELNKARQAYEQAVLAFKQAEIELEKTRLEFLKGATLVSVVDAKKFRGKEGEVMVSVKLRNESDIDKARVAMGEEEETSEDRLRSLLKVDNLIVSIRDEEGIIGDPYQQIVPELKYGEEVTLTYTLLRRDVDVVTVVIRFLEEEKDYTVFLKKEALQDLPTITSTQYAQQGQLGTKIRYDLELERLAKTEQSFSLVVINLPSAFSFAFRDPESDAQITQVKFTSELSKQSLDFEVSIPEKLDREYVDASTSFYILVTRQAEMKNIYELTRQYEGKEVPAEEIAKLTGNKVNLILIPKGTPKVDLVVANLFKEVQIGDPIEIKYSILNSGTLVLRAVTPEIDPPLEWEVTIEPREIPALDPKEKHLVKATLRPPEDVAVGEYTMVLKCEGHSGNEVAEAPEKDFKVRIAPKSNITSTLILVFILVGLVLFIAIASVKISRR